MREPYIILLLKTIIKSRMTIFYDSIDHIALLTAVEGTVWVDTIIPCTLTVIIYIILWIIKDSMGFEVPFYFEEEAFSK